MRNFFIPRFPYTLASTSFIFHSSNNVTFLFVFISVDEPSNNNNISGWMHTATWKQLKLKMKVDGKVNKEGGKCNARRPNALVDKVNVMQYINITKKRRFCYVNTYRNSFLRIYYPPQHWADWQGGKCSTFTYLVK